MTRKQLRYLPSRLESMAEQIQRLNEHPMLRPDVWIGSRGGLSESQKETFGKWLPRLPFLLQLYAAFLKSHSKSLNRYVWQHANRARPQAEMLSALLGIIRQETGRPMWTDLSNVLNAAAGIAGTGETFDPERLKQLDYRKRRKAKPTTQA
jgi:hypothetical protein